MNEQQRPTERPRKHRHPVAAGLVAAVAALGLSIASASAQETPVQKPIPHPGVVAQAAVVGASMTPEESASVDQASSEADAVNGTVASDALLDDASAE